MDQGFPFRTPSRAFFYLFHFLWRCCGPLLDGAVSRDCFYIYFIYLGDAAALPRVVQFTEFL